MTTRAQALDAAADVLVKGLASQAALTARQAAEAAWYPGHPLGSVDAIEAEILARRARHTQAPAVHQSAA